MKRLAELARAAWAAPLWAHAAALTVVLVALVPLMSPTASFTSDDGAYALQAEALEAGSWPYEYRARPYDPEGRHFPVILGDRVADRYYPYVKHPAYPVAIRAAQAVAGSTAGLFVWPVAGAVATAVAAWFLAGLLRPDARRVAFWLAAASPAAVNAFAFWAHAPSAALAGASLVGAVVVARHGLRPLPVAGTTLALTANVLLRSEALLFAGAVVVAVGVARALAGTGWRGAGVAAALGTLPVAAAVAELRWIRSILGGEARFLGLRGSSSSFVADRVAGAWHSLLAGHFAEPAASVPALGAAAAVIVAGTYGLRRLREGSARVVVGAALAALAFLSVRTVLHPTDEMTGLLAAWPVAAVGLTVVLRRRLAGTDRPVLAGSSAAFALAVVATQYRVGGGLEWGGRFFSPLVVPLAALAALALTRGVAAAPTAAARAVGAGALALVVGAGAVTGLATVGRNRAHHDRVIAAVERHPAAVVVTTVDHLPRIAWRTGDHLAWMRVGSGEVADLVGRLRAAGVPDVAVVSPSGDLPPAWPYPHHRRADEPALAASGLELVVLGA